MDVAVTDNAEAGSFEIRVGGEPAGTAEWFATRGDRRDLPPDPTREKHGR